MVKPRVRRHADGTMSLVTDGLQSFATGMGVATRDKAASASYTFTPLDDQQLEAAFRSSWVMRKVVMIPAMDAFRKWREWSGDDAKAVEAVEDAFQVQAKVAECKWKARLYGGAAILIGTGDDDLLEPLNPRSVGRGDLRYLTILSRKEVVSGLIEIDPREVRYGKPRWYEIGTNTGEVLRVHPSRLVEMEGEVRPSWASISAGIYGWGDSVLQSVYEACRNLDATMGNIAALVFEAKVDVVKTPDLIANIIDPAWEQAFLKRWSMARMLKGNHGTLMLDGAEEYDSKSHSFGGLDAIVDRFMQVAAGAADVPMTRLLGQSPAGMSATGESDMLNYHDKLQSIQRLEAQPAMRVLDEVLVRSALGDWPEDLDWEWRPLKQMNEVQISEIRARDAQTVAHLAGSQVFPDDAVAEAGAQMFRESGIDALVMEGGSDD